MAIDARVISEIEAKVKRHMEDDTTGHDWWHIDRVRRNALTICRQEHGDSGRVELIALLHDVDDWKLKAESHSESLAHQWLTAVSLPSEETEFVCEVIERISFKGHGVADEMPFLDGQIVQDADRLDAIGAIGIARCFAYGGAKGRAIYDPEDAPVLHQSFEDYKTKSGPSINHFHEKLLHLKDRMHTPTARKMAEERHAFLERFLDQFQKEWSGC